MMYEVLVYSKHGKANVLRETIKCFLPTLRVLDIKEIDENEKEET